MMAQVWVKGFQATIIHRLICFNLFWHALDIIWVAIFTIVYLLGASADERLRPRLLILRTHDIRDPRPTCSPEESASAIGSATI